MIFRINVDIMQICYYFKDLLGDDSVVLYEDSNSSCGFAEKTDLITSTTDGNIQTTNSTNSNVGDAAVSTISTTGNNIQETDSAIATTSDNFLSTRTNIQTSCITDTEAEIMSNNMPRTNSLQEEATTSKSLSDSIDSERTGDGDNAAKSNGSNENKLKEENTAVVLADNDLSRSSERKGVNGTPNGNQGSDKSSPGGSLMQEEDGLSIQELGMQELDLCIFYI